jgi:hypothetical protein
MFPSYCFPPENLPDRKPSLLRTSSYGSIGVQLFPSDSLNGLFSLWRSGEKRKQLLDQEGHCWLSMGNKNPPERMEEIPLGLGSQPGPRARMPSHFHPGASKFFTCGQAKSLPMKREHYAHHLSMGCMQYGHGSCYYTSNHTSSIIHSPP